MWRNLDLCVLLVIILYDSIYNEVPRIVEFIESESKWWLPEAKGGGRQVGMGDYYLVGAEFQSGKMKSFWRQGDGYAIM